MSEIEKLNQEINSLNMKLFILERMGSSTANEIQLLLNEAYKKRDELKKSNYSFTDFFNDLFNLGFN